MRQLPVDSEYEKCYDCGLEFPRDEMRKVEVGFPDKETGYRDVVLMCQLCVLANAIMKQLGE